MVVDQEGAGNGAGSSGVGDHSRNNWTTTDISIIDSVGIYIMVSVCIHIMSGTMIIVQAGVVEPVPAVAHPRAS